jgi:hypothetical protein
MAAPGTRKSVLEATAARVTLWAIYLLAVTSTVYDKVHCAAPAGLPGSLAVLAAAILHVDFSADTGRVSLIVLPLWLSNPVLTNMPQPAWSVLHPLLVLRRLHSGYAGDYVNWFMAGAAALLVSLILSV